QGDLAGTSMGIADNAAVTVVIAAGDYPASSDVGTPIEGIADAEATGALVFHAGTALKGDRIVTNGGRILNVTAVESSVAAARDRAYEACELISFRRMRYRRDIAAVTHVLAARRHRRGVGVRPCADARRPRRAASAWHPARVRGPLGAP